MKHLKKWFINLSIQRKFLYCALGITLFVLLATSISLYMTASRMVIEQTRKQSAGVINELSTNLDHYFEMVENSFDYIANNNTVQEELKSEEPYYSDGSDYFSYFSRAGQIRRLLLQGYTSVYMNDIQLYGYNGANHVLCNDSETIIKDRWELVFQKAEDAKGSCIYYNAAEDEGLIYIAKQIKDTLTMEPLGILKASIKVNYLQKMTEAARESLTAEIFLLDDDGQTILKSTEYQADGFEDRLEGTGGSFSWSIGHQDYSCVYRKSSNTGFTLVSLIPMSFLQKTVRELQKMAVLLLVGSGILCVILASALARGIAEPIERTSKAMMRFAGGDFSVRLPEGRTDEIGAMNSVFNHTIEEIEQLLKKVVEMERANKEIEFQALQAQINPHFLYNVLDTINWMARKKGEEKICHMVTAISNLMRASISNRKSMVSIAEEMKYIRDYLYIQETRYGERLTSYLDVDERLLEIEIPKMTIQTLVENAVVHGMENATWDCFVSVTGEPEGEFAVIKVRDNGVGIPEEKLRKLLDPDHPEEGKTGQERTHTHLGIYAVRKRLDYICKGKAQMEIRSEPGKGTEITLKIPYMEDRREIIDGTSGHDIGR